MKGGAYPSPFAALAFPNSKKVPIHCWVDRESYLTVAWRSQPPTHNLTATFCTIIEPLLPLDHDDTVVIFPKNAPSPNPFIYPMDYSILFIGWVICKWTNKNCSRQHFNFYFYLSKKNKAWFFMWILCLAEDSLETSSLIFSEKQGENIYECHLLQSWLAL